MPFFLSKNTDFLTNLVIRTSFFLLAILVCLTCAKPTDTDDSNIDPRDSNSAAPSPFIVADDDLGSAWNDLTNLPGAVYRGITSPEPVPQNPTEPDPKPTPPPEDSPAPIPQPECREYTSEFIAVCCVDPPISLAHNPTEDTILYNFFFLTRCSQNGWLNLHGPCGNPWSIFCCTKLRRLNPHPAIIWDADMIQFVVYDTDYYMCYRPEDHLSFDRLDFPSPYPYTPLPLL